MQYFNYKNIHIHLIQKAVINILKINKYNP